MERASEAEIGRRLDAAPGFCGAVDGLIDFKMWEKCISAAEPTEPSTFYLRCISRWDAQLFGRTPACGEHGSPTPIQRTDFSA
jgi:hypothetical protein